MSDDITAILLPASRVDVFALDDGTAATAEKISADWRFARVEIGLVRGDMEAAVERYRHSASPELIIIETNDISEAFTAQLGALAEVCAEGTDAVIIGPTNDVHLYRSLIGMGVRDYLVRPVSEDDMVGMIARTLVEKRGLAGSRLVAVTGSKGGVGATVVAQALAWDIAESLKQKTMLIDAAGSAGTIGISFGLEPASTFADAVRIGGSGSDDDLKRIIQKVTENLSLLVSGGDPLLVDSPDADAIETMIERIMKTYPVIVADLSGASPSVQKRLITRAAHVVVVTPPHIAALRNCRTLVNEIKNARGGLQQVELVLNNVGMPGAEEVPAGDIQKLMDMQPVVKIPFAPKIFMHGESAGKPAGENRAAQDIMKSLIAVAAHASGVEAESADEKSGGFSLLRALGKTKK
ncbi:MAG: CpaE family protein [Alphaproteobacteria bacterium]|jgi:pilus assembly protein CpaE